MTARTANGRDGSLPPRPAAAGDGPPQWFVFGPWRFDVRAAIWLLRGTPRPARPLPVRPWARAYGLTPDSGTGPHSVPLIGRGPGFDPGYAMTTDLSEPVIIATVPVPGGPPAPLLIDGTHRLYKATRLGRAHLPSWVLTQEETLTIRCRPHPGPALAHPRRAPESGNQP